MSVKSLQITALGTALSILACNGTDPGGTTASTGGALGNGGSSSLGTSTSSATGGMSSLSTGVSAMSGGSTSVGATVPAGGASSVGGNATSGGSSATGGMASNGGSRTSAVVVGGATAAGGTTAAGGATATGGRSSTGGSTTNRGGASSVGGKAGAGGTSSAAGGAATGGAATTIKTCAATGTLKQAAACNSKLIGAAISQGSLSNTGYANAAGEFNYFTPENEMKWDTVQASQGNFNYGPGDAIVNFATQRSAKVKGHTLVWHSQLPGWVSSATDVKTVMINHITSVMTHYKGKLHAWDVVNEAVDVDNKKTGMGNARLRDSVFKTKIGTDYIDLAFQTARKVDPTAKLFYNDYSTEGMNDKSDFVYQMVKSMKERGIPIDGVGMQTHIGTPNDSPTAAEVKENINRLAALGLEVQLSELDVNGCDGITDAAMATIYHDLVAACVQQPLCTAITVWGINDGRSWLNTFSEAGCNGQSARALLFTDSYQKKATYTAVLNALTGN